MYIKLTQLLHFQLRNSDFLNFIRQKQLCFFCANWLSVCGFSPLPITAPAFARLATAFALAVLATLAILPTALAQAIKVIRWVSRSLRTITAACSMGCGQAKLAQMNLLGVYRTHVALTDCHSTRSKLKSRTQWLAFPAGREIAICHVVQSQLLLWLSDVSPRFCLPRSWAPR